VHQRPRLGTGAHQYTDRSAGLLIREVLDIRRNVVRVLVRWGREIVVAGTHSVAVVAIGGRVKNDVAGQVGVDRFV
jgi:hypothetical protein